MAAEHASSVSRTFNTVAKKVDYGSGMPMVHIQTAEDPRIAAYQNVRDKDHHRENVFVAEGEVVLRVLCGQKRLAIESIFLSESRAVALADLLESVPHEVPIYVAAQEVMDRIVGFEIHRGILAIGKRTSALSLEAHLEALGSGPLLLVAAIGVVNNDNMGGIFRNAAAFGVNSVLLDSVSCDPMYRKSIRVSVGGVLKVPFCRAESADEMLHSLERHSVTPVALSPHGEHELHAYRFPKRCALLLGAEGAGLSADVLRRSTTVKIQMEGGFDSLNVATTSGIVLYGARSSSVG